MDDDAYGESGDRTGEGLYTDGLKREFLYGGREAPCHRGGGCFGQGHPVMVGTGISGNLYKSMQEYVRK